MPTLQPPFIVACILMATVVAGCKEDTPSDELVKDFLYQTVSAYSLYKESFEIVSWEKKNGWKDNENYVASTSVKLKSKVGYINLLSDCVVSSAANLNGSWAEKTQIQLLAMQSDANGTGKEFVKYWNNSASKIPWPKELKNVSQQTSQTEWNSLLKACDINLLSTYDNIIDRNLSKGTEIVREYQLKFKSTEKGWLGFSG